MLLTKKKNTKKDLHVKLVQPIMKMMVTKKDPFVRLAQPTTKMKNMKKDLFARPVQLQDMKMILKMKDIQDQQLDQLLVIVK